MLTKLSEKINKVKSGEPLLKTPEQVRFIEMMEDLIARYGYSKARVAEVCGISAAMVSLIGKGERSPRFSLERLRQEYDRIIHTEPRAGQPAGSELRDEPGRNAPYRRPARNVLHEQLADLQKFDPKGFALARATIGELHRRIGAGAKPVSSSPGQKAADNLVSRMVTDLVLSRGKKGRGASAK
jgi:hypothetical protein